VAVYNYSKVSIIDNSGARIGRCVQIYKAAKKRGARIGAIILLTLRLVVPDKKIKQGDLSKATIVCSQDWVTRFASYRIKAYASFVTLLFNLSLLPRGKRAKGLMFEEVSKGFSQSSKTLALAAVII
jgi:large subunit ribosomal protein L14